MDKKKQSKKVMAGAITATMIMQLMPINAFAEEGKVDNFSSNMQVSKDGDTALKENKGTELKDIDNEVVDNKDKVNEENSKKEDVDTNSLSKENKVDVKDNTSTLHDNTSDNSVTRISTVTPKENTEVSTLGDKEDTVSKPVEKADVSPIITIPDVNLKNALNKDLGQATGSDITQKQLESLKVIHLANSGIKNLEGLQYCKNVTWIDLANNQISDITPLQGVTALQTLHIHDNKISNITALSGLIALNEIDLSNNQIQDINSLSGLSKLKRINIAYNGITDINPIKNLTNLITLDLADNKISDISVLSNLINLNVLNLSGNKLSNLDAIKGLTKINNLGIAVTGISDISILSNLTNLTTLDAATNSISDIAPLKGLSNLKYVYLNVNSISNIEPLSNLVSLNILDLTSNRISDISLLKNLTNLTTVYLDNQEISLKEVVSHGTAQIGNIIKDENNVVVTPSLISNNGTYNSATGEITWNNITQNVNETYNFKKESKIGGATGEYSGMVTQPILYVSNEKPIIDGANNVAIKEGTSFDPMAGVTATDKEDGNITKDIKVTGSVDTNKPGKYELTYTVTDKDGNTTTVKRVITVNKALVNLNDVPVITAEDKVVKAGTKFDPLVGVTATDKEDGNLTKSIKVIENTVNINKPGVYSVTYEVTDKNGATTKKTITVTVVTNEKPVIDGANNVAIKEGTSFDPMAGVTATDKEDGNITKNIKVTGSVDINKPGKYELTYTVTDKDGNTTTVKRVITVNKALVNLNDVPVITAEDKVVKAGTKFDPMTGVTATDKEDGNLTKSIKVIENTVNINKPGVYSVTYEVTDKNGATTKKTITVTVVTNEKPVIDGANDTTVTEGTSFDPMAGVTATDKEDGNITKNIKITGNVDTNKPGIYEILYTVTDKDGNTTTVKRIVIVKPKIDDIITGSNNDGIQSKPNNVEIGKSEGVIKDKPSSPKTGDVGVLGYLGAGLSAIAGILLSRKKK